MKREQRQRKEDRINARKNEHSKGQGGRAGELRPADTGVPSYVTLQKDSCKGVGRYKHYERLFVVERKLRGDKAPGEINRCLSPGVAMNTEHQDRQPEQDIALARHKPREGNYNTRNEHDC